jgi:hypothetical protein
MTRAPLGIGTSVREPTAVIFPSLMRTTASARSRADRPQLPTSITVPPTRTICGGAGLGAVWDGGWDQAKREATTLPQIHARTKGRNRIENRSVEDCRTRGLGVQANAHCGEGPAVQANAPRGLRCPAWTRYRDVYPRVCNGVQHFCRMIPHCNCSRSLPRNSP